MRRLAGVLSAVLILSALLGLAVHQHRAREAAEQAAMETRTAAAVAAQEADNEFIQQRQEAVRIAAAQERWDARMRAGIEALEAALTAAHDAYDESDGRVLGEATREVLRDTIAAAEEVLHDARDGRVDGGPAVLHEIADSLTAPTADVRDAVEEWETEQERIEREREAERERQRLAEIAAQQTTEQAEQQTTSPQPQATAEPTETAPSTPSEDHVERVIASAQPAGWQAALDRCAGSVRFYGYGPVGDRIVGEHWTCAGGDAFPRWAGAVVRFEGQGLDGTYRVLGVVATLSATRHDTGDVPTGYDLLYQTCLHGSSEQMVFVALDRL